MCRLQAGHRVVTGRGGVGSELSDSWETDSSSCESLASSVLSMDVSETRKRNHEPT